MVETAVPHDWAVHFSNSAGVTQSVTPTVTDLDSPLVHLSITPSAQITLNPATASQISGMTAVTLAGSVLQMSGTPEALTRALGVITFTANAIGSGQLDVRISDVSLTDAATRAPQSIHIQAQAAADRTPPTLGLNATSLETPENQTLISATLPGLFRPSEGVVWSFDASGVDNSRFNLNPLTGEISWKVAPDFETASQTLITEGPYSGDKRFNLAFKAIDLSGNVSQPLSLGVHLQDVNEAPQRVTSAGTPAGTEHRWATLAQLGNLYSLDLSTLFQDPEAGDALTYSASIPVGWLSLAANGRLTASGSLPATDTRVDFEVTATDRLGLSATVPISLHAVAQSAPQVIGLNVKDNAGDAWVGNASQTLTLNVLFNTADLRVTGNPTATVVIAGAAYTAFFTGATTAWSTQQGAAQGVLSFALSVPSGVNTEGVTLTGIQNALGSSIVNPSNGAALDTSTTYAFSAPYVVDHTAPARPVVQLASGLSQTGVSASALASHPGGVLDVVTEPGASLSVLFSNANEPNQRVSKTLDTALLGLNPIALTPNEATQLGVGSINAQIIAIDPAGNRSDPAWFNLTVI